MKQRLTVGVLLLGLSMPALAQSPMTPNASPPPPPPAVATRPAPAAPDMQAVLDALQSLGAKPIETLTPVEARIQPSAADAVMHRQGLSTLPDQAVTTHEMPYGSDSVHNARIYRPAAATGVPKHVIVYYHGGGWVIADINTYDATPRLVRPPDVGHFPQREAPDAVAALLIPFFTQARS